MAKRRSIFALVLLTDVLAVALAAFWYWNHLSSQGAEAFRPDATETIPFEVARGSSAKSVARDLAKAGLVEDEDRFYRYLRYVAKRAERLRAGEYELRASMSADELIAELGTGRQRELRFTVPEGASLTDIAKAIAGAGIADEAEVRGAMASRELLGSFGVPARGAGGQVGVPGGMEGYLFPDTYQFPKGTSATEVLRRMRARLDEVMDDEMKARMREMGWDLHKTLTLAAIVEKETGQPHERPHIASVFHNRLRLGMKLQTDPTVIYGIANYDGNIRKKDLLTPHPYNTYTIAGLPPGPIASPGKAALRAVLWPDESDDLYFVSRNDGTHIFCPTLTCHNAAVQRWQVEFFRKKKAAAALAR